MRCKSVNTGLTTDTQSERAARHYETLLQAQRKIQEELEKVDAETRREVDENIRHEQAVTQLFAQSEPTTPPEYQNAFPNNFSRPNRYSTASLISPPGIASRPNRASTQLTSPSGGYVRPYTANNSTTSSNLPSQSVPGSRRESDDEQEEPDFVYGFEHTLRRSAAKYVSISFGHLLASLISQLSWHGLCHMQLRPRSITAIVTCMSCLLLYSLY